MENQPTNAVMARSLQDIISGGDSLLAKSKSLLEKSRYLNNELIQLKKQFELSSDELRNTLSFDDLVGKEYIYGKYQYIFDGRTEGFKLTDKCGIFMDTLNGKKILPYYNALRVGNLDLLKFFLSRFTEIKISESFMNGENYLFVLSRDFDMEEPNEEGLYDIDEMGFPVHVHSGYVIKL